MEQIPKSIFERTEEVKKRLNDFTDSRPGEDLIGLLEKRNNKAFEIKSKYKDPLVYALYHVLIGSTLPDGGEVTEYDFPGEDSVEAFIDNLIEKR